MKIGILSQNPNSYSTHRLFLCAQKKGHEVRLLNPLKCYMSITSSKPTIKYMGEILESYDAIIPRIGANVTFYGTAVVRQFEMMGIFCLNKSTAISCSRDKLHSMQILSQRGIGMPITGFAHATRSTGDLIKMVNGPPLIIKLLQGTQGKGVVMAESKRAAESVIDAFRQLDAYFLVQEFVNETNLMDIRCLVIGDIVVASMARYAREGDFRANLHQGGHALPIKITPQERSTAIKATKAMGLDIAGVDILRSSRGPLVLEVNSSPGLEGIEKVTQTPIAEKILAYIENNRPIHKKPKNVII